MQTQHPEVAAAGSQQSVKMHPGGGAQSEKVEKQKQPVAELYTKPSPNEKGTVDASKVAALKANAKRPPVLKRTTKIKLDKEEKKKLIKQRKEAAEKYKERSAERKKNFVYRTNAAKRKEKQVKKLAEKREAYKTVQQSRSSSNMTLVYSVGPQPKYKSISADFRAFRKFESAKFKALFNKKTRDVTIETIYKVGTPGKGTSAAKAEKA